MSVLRPIPLAALVRRAAAEIPRGSIYDLPLRRVYRGFGGRDLSALFHGRRCATPLGPAAGPHTQLAQNVALAYLAGGRILELKTVQANDAISVPRPCIDARTVGFNVEWSQELPLADSLREYVKARLLVAILAELADVPAPERDGVFEVSVGYGLEGIRSRKMSDFLDGVADGSALLDAERAALRRELPAPLRRVADVPCDARLSESVTLSTFHGCPPEEIAAIGRHLLSRGFHTVVKLNPTLLGYESVEEILHGRLGYAHLELRRAAFERDLRWDAALALARDLSAEAARRGLGFGLKLTNTLVVGNRTGFLPGDDAYLSGEPLHVLALALGVKIREALGAAFPLSFSAGIDAANVAGAVACGFVPVTSCTDLLRPGGYQRLHRQVEALASAMGAAGASTLNEFVLARAGAAAEDAAVPGDATEASLGNHRRAAAEALVDERYAAPRTSRQPRKIGSRLGAFDCVNCDKCVSVCPNDANVAYDAPPRTVVSRDLAVSGGRLEPGAETTLTLGGRCGASHQIANWADACNDCGNCDVFCPEDGGPHVAKPRLFSSPASFRAAAPGPGVFLRREAGSSGYAEARWDGAHVSLSVAPDGSAVFRDGVAELRFSSAADAAPSAARLLDTAREGDVVRVGRYHALRALLDGLFAEGAVSWLTATDPNPNEWETPR